MSNRTPIVAVVACIVACLVGLLTSLLRGPKNPPEAPEVGRREVRAAFVAPKLHEGDLPAEIPILFKEVGEEFRDRKGANAVRFFDVDRMVDEIDTERFFSRGERTSFATGMKGSLNGSLVKLSEVLNWDRTEIRHLRWYDEGSDAVVITRHTFADETGGDLSFKMRWWLFFRNGQWRIYDFEDMTSGGRATVLMGTMLKQLMANGMKQNEIARIRQVADQMNEVRTAIFENNFVEAEQLLEKPMPTGMPAQLTAILYFWKGTAKISLSKAQEGLDAIDEAEKLDPAMPGIHLLRTIAHNQLGNHTEAIESAQKFLAELGPDEMAYFQLGSAYFALNQPDEARDFYRKGFNEAPNSPDWLDPFRQTLDPNQKKEFGERFAKLSKPEQHFVTLFTSALDDGDEESAQELITVFRKLAPNNPQGLIREGQLLLKKDQVDEAGKRFLEALALPAPKADDEESDVLYECVTLFAEKRGQKDAYELFSKRDARRVFRVLLDSLLENDEDFEPGEEKKQPPLHERLEKLIALHRAKEPKDPWLAYATGEMYSHVKDYEAAEKAYAEAFEKVTDSDEKEIVRDARISALCELGRGVIAYEKIDTTPATFDQVANHLVAKVQGDELAKLIAVRKQKEPNATDLHYWNGQLNWVKKNYPEAAKHYRKFKSLDDKKYSWIIDDRLIRCLLRTKQFALAQKEIETGKEAKFGQQLHAAILAAYQGDAAKLGEELERLKEEHFNEFSFHNDEDLGPLLREKPEFRKLLEKYPVPKDFAKPGKEL